jgi:16S rRNA (uracil1498-N3)-methyltransferase
VDRVDLATVASFVCRSPLVAGETVDLGEEVAHHMHVRRLDVGEQVGLRDGSGGVGTGVLQRLAKSSATVAVREVRRQERPPAVHMLVPVADRDRMLWLAEKCTELGAASWRPVMWSRSRSVSPRGEGDAFEAKVRARMAGALSQCEGAWLPAVHATASPGEAIAGVPAQGARLLLDVDGAPLATRALTPPVTVAVGPEGGFERAERDQLVAAGFAPVALPGNVLRFETAGVTGLALALAALATSTGGNGGWSR